MQNIMVLEEKELMKKKKKMKELRKKGKIASCTR